MMTPMMTPMGASQSFTPEQYTAANPQLYKTRGLTAPHGEATSEETLLLSEPAGHLPPSSSAPQEHQNLPASNRFFYLDYLKVFLTFTVVVHHCVVIYADGFYPYYGEWRAWKDQTQVSDLISWAVLQFNQSYFMGLFFFISGLVAVPSLERKGPRAYLKDRAVRLLIPALVFDALIGPILFAIAKKVNDFNVPDGLSSSSSSWSYYWVHYNGVGANPMWFLWALTLFDLGLVTHFTLTKKNFVQLLPTNSYATIPTNDPSPASPPSTSQHLSTSAMPSEPYTTKQMVQVMTVLAAGLSLSCYLVRIVFPINFWLPLVFPGFQLAYAAQYITAFVLGTVAFRRNALTRLPRIGGACLAISAFLFFWGFIISVVLLFSNGKSGVGPLFGGGGIESFYFTIFEQSFGVIWSVGLLVFFREHVNKRPSLTGKTIIHATYPAYLIHTLVVFSFTRLLTLAWVPMGSFTLLLHILITTILSVPMTWMLAIGIKLIPGAGKVV